MADPVAEKKLKSTAEFLCVQEALGNLDKAMDLDTELEVLLQDMNGDWEEDTDADVYYGVVCDREISTKEFEQESSNEFIILTLDCGLSRRSRVCLKSTNANEARTGLGVVVKVAKSEKLNAPGVAARVVEVL